MKYRKPLSSILLSAFFLLATSSTSSASSQTVDTTVPLPRLIGTEIIDGLMKVEGATTRTSVGLTVNFLGDSGLIDWERQKNNVQTATMTLSNSHLGVESEIDAAIESVRNPEEQLILKEAFEYLKENEGDIGGMYNTYWRPSALPLEESSSAPQGPRTAAISQLTLRALFNTGLTGSEYFSLLRDRNVARNLLLRRHKLQYVLTLKPAYNDNDSEASSFASSFASPFDDNDVFTATPQDVEWEIKVYRAIQISDPEVVFYRFAIRAVTEKPHDFLIPTSYWAGSAGTEVSAAVYLVDEEEQKIPLGSLTQNGLEISDIASLTIPNSEATATANTNVETVKTGFVKALQVETADDPPNTLGDIFSFFGTPGQVSSLIGRALTQSPIEGNSIITGGMIGFSEESRPEAMVGVNQRFASFGSFDAGLLLGATLQNDTSIFIGPSLRYSLVTLGLGARLAGEDSLELDGAGIVSIDISKLLTDNDRPENDIVIGNPRRGGNVGEIANFIAQDQMLAVVSLDTPPEVGDSIKIEFTRTHTEIGCEGGQVTENSLNSAEFTVTKGDEHLRFIPKGCYKGKLDTPELNAIENGYVFGFNGGPLVIDPDDNTFRYEVTRDGLQTIDLDLVNLNEDS